MNAAPQPRRGRPRDASKTRAILHAASHLFLRNGFRAVSMDAIAERARVSKQTLYTHFHSKEALFRAVIVSKVEIYTLVDLPDPETTTDVRAILVQLGQAMMRLITDAEAVDMMRVVIAESRDYPKVARLFYESGPDHCFQHMVRTMERLASRHDIQCPDPHRAAREFSSLCKRELDLKLLMGMRPRQIRARITEQVQQAVDGFMAMYAAQR